MDIQTIVQILKNAGFHVIGADRTATYLVIEQPNCIIRSFETFLGYAWIIIVFITGILLFGWAISKIRGATTDLVKNFQTLIIIFGALSAIGPIIKTIYGGDIAAHTCQTVKLPLADIQKLLDARKLRMSDSQDLYERINIYFDDSNAQQENEDISDLESVRVPLDLNPYAGGSLSGSESGHGPIATEQMPVIPIFDMQGNNGFGGNGNNNSPLIRNLLPSGGGDNGPHPVQAHQSGNNVVYAYANNRTKEHRNGTRAWRNTNPGNIRRDKNRAIGSAGGFAIYPSEEAGMQAIIRLLRGPLYRNKNIAQAMHTYAPASDGNNPTRYANILSQRTGISLNRTMGSLNDREIRAIAQEIKRHEGWKPGQVIMN